MKKSLYILTALILAASAFGIQPQFIRQFDGAENIYAIDPILDNSGQLSGLIFCIPTGNEIVVDIFGGPGDIHVALNMPPVKTIHAYFDPDTLYIYAVQRSFASNAYVWLSLIKVFDNQAVVDTTVRNYLNNIYGLQGYSSFENLDIKFANDSNEVILETCAYFEEYFATEGIYACNASMTRAYSRDLRTVIDTWDVSSMTSGNIDSDPEIDTCSYTDSYMYYESYEPGDTPFELHGTSVTAGPFSSFTDHGNTREIFLHNFISSDQYDELIYYGYAHDWTDNYPNTTNHMACYGFSSITPVEYWYNNQIGLVDFSYIYDKWKVLAGIRNDNRLIFMDYTDGQISDSISLGKDFHATRFFETGLENPMLSLVGRSNDSIFVYYIDSPVGVDDGDSDPFMPDEFRLVQNFPNPFNSATTIGYYLPGREQVTISIYNLLGQRISTIYDDVTPAGYHSVDWNATSVDGQPVASGVYLYQIKAADHSQARKMIYLK